MSDNQEELPFEVVSSSWPKAEHDFKCDWHKCGRMIYTGTAHFKLVIKTKPEGLVKSVRWCLAYKDCAPEFSRVRF